MDAQVRTQAPLPTDAVPWLEPSSTAIAPAVPVETPPTVRNQPSEPPKAVELAQRGKIILDVAAADLEVAEARLGPFHETSRHFREALAEARRSWDRLRARYGTVALETTLNAPPSTVLTIEGIRHEPVATLILIGGRTYRVEGIAGTDPAPVQWRLTRLPLQEDGPYYACRLRDGTLQCDCAEWTYNVADNPTAAVCKHLAALRFLGWI